MLKTTWANCPMTPERRCFISELARRLASAVLRRDRGASPQPVPADLRGLWRPEREVSERESKDGTAGCGVPHPCGCLPAARRLIKDNWKTSGALAEPGRLFSGRYRARREKRSGQGET